MSEERSKDIILELKKSFLEDKLSLQNRIVEIEAEIRQCNDYIESLSKKDDNDYNVFSPRNASTVYKDQVSDRKEHIDALEATMRELYKKLSNVTKKLDSLDELDPSELSDAVDAGKALSSGNHSILIKMQEDDRKRIAADLHDGVLQNLTLVMHNLELSAKFIDYDPVRAKLEMETNRKLVKDTIDEIRTTIYDLRPMQFDDLGFKKAMENHICYYADTTPMQIIYDIDEISDVDYIYLITVFRITQELLINAIKHSKASKTTILIKDDGKFIKVMVKDDGVGFSVHAGSEENHFGLAILKEKVSVLGGTVSFDSGSTGTTVKVEIPLYGIKES